MKGAIFLGLSTFVEENFGLSAWLQAIENCDLPSNGQYISSDFYADEELVALVTELSQLSGKPASELIRNFGIYSFNGLFNSIAHLVADIDNLFDFLESVDKVIHIEVQKSDPFAYTPSLYYDVPNSETMIIRYLSKRKLCFFAEGLILAAASHFKEKIEIKQLSCMHDGDKHCLIQIRRLI